MPAILKWNGFRFYFFSNEGYEPPHIHVDKGGCSTKLWLSSLEVEYNYGFKEKEINVILSKINEKQSDFLEAWNAHFKI